MDEETAERALNTFGHASSNVSHLPFDNEQYMADTKFWFPVLLQCRNTDVSICWIDVGVEDLRNEGACEAEPV